MAYDANGSYEFKTLESKYSNFISPSFGIKVGSFKIDSAKVPISSLSVQISVQNKAGTCSFSIEAQYDYATGKWAGGFLEKVDVGLPVEVEAGYADSKKRIFYGYVDECTIEYTSEAAPRLSITALDGMGQLMNSSEERDFGALTTTDVVKKILADCKEAGSVESVDVDTLPTFRGQFVKDKACTNYDFVCKLAEMLFMNFSVVDGQMIFKNLISSTKALIKLTMGVSLLSFQRKTAITRTTVGSVTVISNGADDKKEIRSVADTPSSYGGSGKTGAKKWAALGGVNKDMQMNFLKTADECKLVAQSVLDGMCLGFVTGEGRCIGIPEMIPGRYVTIAGLDDKTNGDYFVTDVTHDFSGDGYFTTFTVKGLRSK